MSFQVGQTVGDYQIAGLIGSGGVGEVFKVEHVITRRVEAMKILLSGRQSCSEQAQRFLREIQIQASLSHPNIASVHNAFWTGEDLVMVMELVEGESLKRILERGRPPLSTALDYARQALAALEYAHAHQVTHRDITPGNMLVTAADQVKLTDFGLAKSPTDLRLTQSGAVVGSLYYMSPEQVRAEPAVDTRSDIYSMGAVLYELVTGVKPFNGNSAFAIMSAHVGKEPPSVLGMPAQLNGIISKALKKDPSQRFQSAGEFRAALELVRPAPAKKRAAPWVIGAVAALLAIFWPRSSPPAPVIAAILPSAKPALKQEPAPRRPPAITAEANVWSLALSPSGKWLAGGTEDGVIEIWDVASGEKRARLRGPGAGVTALSFSRDEKSLASGGADRSARIWNLTTKAERDNFKVNCFVTTVALSADGQWLAAGSSDKRVKVWNLTTSKRTAGFRGKQEPQALAFSPNGNELAVAGSGGVRLWDVITGREIQSLSSLSATSLTFARDGHCLALIAGPKGLRLWDATGSRQLASFPSHRPIRASAISQNGKTVAISAGGKTISLTVGQVF